MSSCRATNAKEIDEQVKAALASAALEERIVDTLAAAGIEGLGFGDLGDAISHQLEAAVGVEAWENVDSFDLDTPLAAALVGGVVLERDDETLTLSPAEWARRLVHEAIVPLTGRCTVALTSLLDDHQQIEALRAEFERMLSGNGPRKQKDDE